VRVPVLFITASDDPGLDRETGEAGGVRLLRKPFSNRELLAAIESALRWAAEARH
jgi:DNA-binding response OmpR family regulator